MVKSESLPPFGDLLAMHTAYRGCRICDSKYASVRWLPAGLIWVCPNSRRYWVYVGTWFSSGRLTATNRTRMGPFGRHEAPQGPQVGRYAGWGVSIFLSNEGSR